MLHCSVFYSYFILHLRHYTKSNKDCLTAYGKLVPWDHKIVYGNDTVIDLCVGAGRLLLAFGATSESRLMNQ